MSNSDPLQTNQTSPLLSADAQFQLPLKKKLASNLLFVCLIISLNTMQFGFNIGSLNVPQKVLTTCEADGARGVYFIFDLLKCVRFTDVQYSTLTSLLPLGGLLGCLLCNSIISRLGRKTLMTINSLFFFFASLGTFMSENVNSFLFYRFISGACTGIALILVPVYLAEISPSNLKGTMGMLTSISTVTGIIVSQTMGIAFAVKSWRMIFFSQALISLFNLAAMLKCPESFIHLLKTSIKCSHSSDKIHYYNRAERSLRSVRHKDDSIQDELKQTVESFEPNTSLVQDDLESRSVPKPLDTTESNVTTSTFALFKNSLYLPSILFLMFIHITQQFSGINAIMYYSTTIFEPVFGYKPAQYISIAINVLQLIMNLIVTKIIEKYGRKFLFVVSSVGMGIFLSFVAIFINTKYSNISTLISMFVAIGFYAIALGPMPFILIADVFDKKSTDAASSVSIATNLFFNFVVAISFPILSNLLMWPNKNYEGNVFFVFSFYLFIAAFVVFKVLPETKNRQPTETMTVLRKNFKSLISRN